MTKHAADAVWNDVPSDHTVAGCLRDAGLDLPRQSRWTYWRRRAIYLSGPIVVEAIMTATGAFISWTLARLILEDLGWLAR